MDYPVLMFLAASLILPGCGRAPEAYPPPIQFQLSEEFARLMPYTSIGMGEPEARHYIVGGMRDFAEGVGWRWTHERPELRFRLDRTDGWKFAADFSFPESNFKQTGPVTVSFFVNGKLLETVRYTTPGAKHFERGVAAEWLRKDEYTLVAATIDPVWQDSGSMKEKLGFVLYRAGFVR